MSAIRVLALVLIVAGLVIVLYGSFFYSKTVHEAQIGSIEVKVTKHDTLDTPVWVGLAAMVLGALLLLAGKAP